MKTLLNTYEIAACCNTTVGSVYDAVERGGITPVGTVVMGRPIGRFTPDTVTKLRRWLIDRMVDDNGEQPSVLFDSYELAARCGVAVSGVYRALDCGVIERAGIGVVSRSLYLFSPNQTRRLRAWLARNATALVLSVGWKR